MKLQYEQMGIMVRMVAFDNPNHLVTKVGRSILLVFGFKKKVEIGLFDIKQGGTFSTRLFI